MSISNYEFKLHGVVILLNVLLFTQSLGYNFADSRPIGLRVVCGDRPISYGLGLTKNEDNLSSFF